MFDTGSPLSVAILGVSTVETATAFYRDVIGLDRSPIEVWKGAAFEKHFRLPAGSSARAATFSNRSSPGIGPKVGRVLAVEFDAVNRKMIPQPGDRTYRGLWNLNFYVDDIRAMTKKLQGQGFNFWTEPVGYEVSTKAGRPVEVLFDGPDGLAINLVELTGDENSDVGRMKKEIAKLGRTPTGFTQVSTTSHSISDRDRALAFYTEVLGMHVHIDAVLDKPETNHFLGRPRDAKTRATFVMGAHQFGKVALSHPMNYAVPEKVALAVPPNIGYLAQGFAVPSLDDALGVAARVGAEPFSDPVDIEMPGIGKVRAAIVRNPGSGALMDLFEEK